MTTSKTEIEARINRLMEEVHLLQNYGIRREQIVFIVSLDMIETMFSFQCAITGMFHSLQHEFVYEINGYPVYVVKKPNVFGSILSCAIKVPPYMLPPYEVEGIMIVDADGDVYSRFTDGTYMANGISVHVWDYAIEENATDDSFTAPLESDTKELDAFLDSLNGMVNR